ncbi:hypothetical protein DPM19_25545 [Actinomadura craniellae]|uniref:histidine kinase n=1 Tax=Actinomadura craniellae TaxID=2231787 RepID=A0A365H090_9ACTN|nr:nitrate- and nitrite sensing domain-containing protein [Actinomadura craniellae]RAY12499.1 hypothetical protein DPM19_25545 [Actinomadura craniellae]
MSLARIRRGSAPALPPAGPPRQRRGRVRSIRLRIVGLLVIPLVSLLALWAFAASLTLDAALDKRSIDRIIERFGNPARQMTASLQVERSLSALVLGTRGRMGTRELEQQRAKSDAALAAFRRTALTGENKEHLGGIPPSHIDDLVPLLDRVPTLRSAVDARQLTPLAAINGYNAAVDGLNQLFRSITVSTDVRLQKQGSALVTLGFAFDHLQRENALITAIQAGGGRMTVADHSALVQWVGTQRLLFSAALGELGSEQGVLARQLSQSPDLARLRAIEDAIVNTPRQSRLPLEAAGWQPASLKLTTAWANISRQSIVSQQKETEPVAQRVQYELIAAAGFGLLAVVMSVLLSVLFGRRLIRELTGLQGAARDLAENRLPGVVARLRGGEAVDVQAEAPRLEVGGTTEIARVADAFSQVQRTAVETAVGEAHLRRGISRIFLNLAWRSQSLLHRQLRMLDSMERRTTDPEALEDLFRLDHLTTRMRRHAEGLVILSGAPSSRSWSKPVLLVDVLRGAVAEVEDYTRVEVASSSRAALEGSAVADVIHLLAELVENATAFSPPPTEVLVRGETVANGFAIDVIDRGIGLTPEDLAELNARLIRPPEFDLADSDRLGLFVVAQLASRHGIQVSLQPSAYGGTTAVVLIPSRLVAQIEDFELDRTASRPADFEPDRTASGPPLPHQSDRRPWFQPQEDPSAGSGNGPHPVGEFREAAPVTPIFGPGTAPERTAPASVQAPEPTEGGLPRRVRQANLAPQLRESPSAQEETGPQERPAEESQNLMAALQNGWLRGREDENDDEIPHGPGREWGDS